MAIATSNDDAYDYILLEDRKRPEEEQTRWTFNILDQNEHAKAIGLMQNFFQADGTLNERKVNMKLLTSACREVCHMGMRGWVNYRTPKGDPVEFEMNGEGKVKPELLVKWFRFRRLQELANAILANQFLTEDDLKN